MNKVLLLFFVAFLTSFSPKNIEKYKPIKLNDDLELGHNAPKNIHKVDFREKMESKASMRLGMILNSDLVITEIMYNPSNSDNAWEWVEIYNSGLEEINLSGFVFDDDDGAILTEANIPSGTLPAGSSAILFNESVRTAEQFRQAWGEVNLIPVTTWGALNNTGDAIAIWESYASYIGDNETQTNAIERVIYDNNSGDWPDDDGAGSIYLTDVTAGNSLGVNWVLSIDGVETPLFQNYVSTPFANNLGLDIGSPGVPDIDDNEPPAITCPLDLILAFVDLE